MESLRQGFHRRRLLPLLGSKTNNNEGSGTQAQSIQVKHILGYFRYSMWGLACQGQIIKIQSKVWQKVEVKVNEGKL
jgi:hypothetical protein